MEDYKQHDPIRIPDETDDQTDITTGFWEGLTPPVGEREYGSPMPAPPISVDDSHKFGAAETFKQ